MNDQMAKLMAQAQKMQTQMMEQQEKLNTMTFTGTAGGGMAKAVVNGKLEVLSVKVMQEAVDPDDAEMLEDVILAAIQDAQKQASQARETQMSSAMGGIKIPGLF